ncbi:MAG: hypothetical protein QM776_11490 [Rhodocyclaceae bacterium]
MTANATPRLAIRFLGLFMALVAFSSNSASESASKISRSKDQLEYFIPPPLIYTPLELQEIRQAGVYRNVSILKNQTKEAEDRIFYYRERQITAEIDADRRKWTLEFDKKIYGRQRIYSEIVFWVSNIIVLTGLILTIRQFNRDGIERKSRVRHDPKLMRRKPGTILATAKQNPAPQDRPETKIILRPDGIEIGTRVTGLAILVISLGFYYLMLNYVYTISETAANTAAGNSVVATKK